MPPDGAAALLTWLASRPGVNEADPATEMTNRLCGHLPPAIGMLARQLHYHPAWSAEMIVFAMHMPVLESLYFPNPAMRAKPVLLYSWIASG
jgi:hypothetical protein